MIGGPGNQVMNERNRSFYDFIDMEVLFYAQRIGFDKIPQFTGDILYPF
jgi:hypothetical protein